MMSYNKVSVAVISDMLLKPINIKIPLCLQLNY